MENNRVLLIMAHPSIGRSEVNSPLFEEAKKIKGVTCVDLYAEYPTFNINIDKEQKRLLEHDVIVFQFPLYWYSTPALLKEWQDLVLEYGFAYGNEGESLHGKHLLCSVSAGGAQDAYQTDGFNHFTSSELLRPLEQMANLLGMNYVPPFVLFGARSAVEEKRLEKHLKQWEVLLKKLVRKELDLHMTEPLMPKFDLLELSSATSTKEASL
jgi:putative NADPH-quinone reductase